MTGVKESGNSPNCQIHDRDIMNWDTESHSGQLSIQIRDDFPDGLGGSSWSWDDILSSWNDDMKARGELRRFQKDLQK